MANDLTTALDAKFKDLDDDQYDAGPPARTNADMQDQSGTFIRLLNTCKGTHGWEATGAVDINTALWLKIPH